MHAAHAHVDRVEHHANGLVHQPPQPELRADQVRLVPVRLPHHLRASFGRRLEACNAARTGAGHKVRADQVRLVPVRLPHHLRANFGYG